MPHPYRHGPALLVMFGMLPSSIINRKYLSPYPLLWLTKFRSDIRMIWSASTHFRFFVLNCNSLYLLNKGGWRHPTTHYWIENGNYTFLVDLQVLFGCCGEWPSWCWQFSQWASCFQSSRFLSRLLMCATSMTLSISSTIDQRPNQKYG